MRKNVTGSTFDQEFLQGAGPALADVWAEWGTPCQPVAVVLERIADEQNLTLAQVLRLPDPASHSAPIRGKTSRDA